MSLVERFVIVFAVFNAAMLLMAWGLNKILDWRVKRAEELTEWWDNLDIGGYKEIPVEAQAEYIKRYRKIWGHYPWHMMKKVTPTVTEERE